MPNPLFLQVMGVSIHEYNSYSPAKKARFQKIAQQKLIDVHESDIDAYCELTSKTAQTNIDDAADLLESEAEDKENS
jgi:hypothetical protein